METKLQRNRREWEVADAFATALSADLNSAYGTAAPGQRRISMVTSAESNLNLLGYNEKIRCIRCGDCV